jgi:hypothetical protein
MDAARTCGKGLAENAALPAKLGQLTSALADTLEAHLKTIEIADEAAREEHGMYVRLVREFRRTAVELEESAAEMAGARDLPMGRHHDVPASNSEALEAFEKLVKTKRELLTLLESSAARDQRMLVEMAAAASRELH